MKVSEVGEIMGRKRGRERKGRKAGRRSLAGQTRARLEGVCPATLREEGGREISTLLLVATE